MYLQSILLSLVKAQKVSTTYTKHLPPLLSSRNLLFNWSPAQLNAIRGFWQSCACVSVYYSTCLCECILGPLCMKCNDENRISNQQFTSTYTTSAETLLWRIFLLEQSAAEKKKTKFMSSKLVFAYSINNETYNPIWILVEVFLFFFFSAIFSFLVNM